MWVTASPHPVGHDLSGGHRDRCPDRVAGLTGDRTAWVTTRPCGAPHETISDVGLIGGGQVPMPGEVSRAHHGARLLDERPECRRHVLEVLRQPLEESLV
jgi:magnesium chelatase family protein